jgi:hypothetical protein
VPDRAPSGPPAKGATPPGPGVVECLVFIFHARYSKEVDIEITFKQSVFRHGVSEADIHHAFTNPRYDGPIEDTETGNRYIRLGFDTQGNLLELLYNEYDTHVCIFHAMRCRNMFFSLLED